MTASPAPSQTATWTATPTATPSATGTPTPVLSRPYFVELTVYDSSGHQVQALPSVWLTLLGDTGLSLSSPTLAADGEAQVSVFDSAGQRLGAWNGVHADGGLVAPGAYRIHVRWSENGALLAEKDAVLMVQPQANALLQSLLVAPNPAGRDASQQASLRWVPDAKTVWVRGHIYNIAGERVQSGEVLAAQGRIDWGLRSAGGEAVSSGVYVWEVEAIDGNGRVLERRGVKFFVLR